MLRHRGGEQQCASNSEAKQQSVWREGDRIRRTDGTGYADFVTDDDIRAHIAAKYHDDPLFLSFAAAVLAIREFERVSRG